MGFATQSLKMSVQCTVPKLTPDRSSSRRWMRTNLQASLVRVVSIETALTASLSPYGPIHQTPTARISQLNLVDKSLVQQNTFTAGVSHDIDALRAYVSSQDRQA
ncbi:hypothetical protein PoB_003306900 [Plakobranchus ocellatus]|uniref:Uncharacterized protein n=1 Tax=Plakobranchus ocellatus TaxID=259542 RepID=A0AAV4AJF0_9GAST|nr:hypothetical protein PoB_003306900 [Plakobranchus ocellatus]